MAHRYGSNAAVSSERDQVLVSRANSIGPASPIISWYCGLMAIVVSAEMNAVQAGPDEQPGSQNTQQCSPSHSPHSSIDTLLRFLVVDS